MYFGGRKDFQIKHQETIIHLTWTKRKTVTHTKLHININHKTANEMVEQYNFNQEQKNQLAEFQKEEYTSIAMLYVAMEYLCTNLNYYTKIYI